jgi:hypothetical protein
MAVTLTYDETSITFHTWTGTPQPVQENLVITTPLGEDHLIIQGTHFTGGEVPGKACFYADNDDDIQSHIDSFVGNVGDRGSLTNEKSVIFSNVYISNIIVNRQWGGPYSYDGTKYSRYVEYAFTIRTDNFVADD